MTSNSRRKNRGKNPPRESELDELLAADAGKWKGGRRCTVCTHKQADRINALSLDLLRRRRAGETHYPWATFCSKHLRPKYGFTGTAPTLKRHLEHCLGEEIE